MKKIVLISSIIFVLNYQAKSQEAIRTDNRHEKMDKDKSPEERAKNNTAKAEKDLGLTAEQKIKWEAATLERIRANEPFNKKLEGSTTPQERKELRQQTKVNNDKFVQTVSVFLNPDQKTKFEKMKHGKGRGQRKKAGKDSTSQPSIINK